MRFFRILCGKSKKKHESVSLTSRPIESILGTIQFPFCKELNLPRRAHFFSPEAFRFMFHSVSAASYRSATSLFNIAYRQNAPNDMNTSSIHQEMNRAFSDIRKYETELVKKVFRENGLTITGKLKKGKRWKDSIVNPSPSLLSTDGARQITSQEIVDAIERFNYDKPDYLKINHDDVLESIERYPGGAVYIAPDGCCTHHQKDKRNRYKDGVRYRDGEKMGERVNTYNVNIQVNGEEYTVTADSLQSALRLTLAFLLNNRLLENRQLIIFTDGGKDIKKQCSSIFADIPHQFIIDWYHLRKKCREFFSMALQSGRKYKASRAEVSKAFFNILWVGNLEGAKAYLKTIDHSLIKSGEQLAKMMAYLDRKQYAFTCFAIRRMLKLRLSSNLVEKDNNVIISTRQKKNGMSWSTEGSTGLGLLTCLQHNDEMENWLTNHTLHFSMRSMRKKISA